MFIRGRIATDDGTLVPHDAVVERVCNSRVRQQVYASSHGDFTMELGSRNDAFLDASAEGGRDRLGRTQANPTPGLGISRQELMNCEVRATISGFQSSVVNLVALTPDSGSINIGDIAVHRTTKVKGGTLSASPYQAPKEARKAFEKGMKAEKDGKLADARKYFEQAVALHPKYLDAWYQLGSVLQNLEQDESARAAYVQAATIDSRFAPPYLALASMAFRAEDWTQVLNLTDHLVELDPLKNANVTGYIVDFDPLDYAQAYFYNAAANYRLNRIGAAEKSALHAARLDVRSRFPQLHLLLATIFARKGDNAAAISETKIYLALAPSASDADRVRVWMAELEKHAPAADGAQAAPN